MKFDKSLLKQEHFLETVDKINIESAEFEKLMFVYSLGLKELKTKFEIIKEEFEYLYDYTLIDNINTRIKSKESILKKMKSKNYEITYKNLIGNINDIAGIRVICNFKDDIFLIKELVQHFPNVKIIKEKDYVNKPKKSGYSSYHMIVEVPVNIAKKIVLVKVEIQIRTKAMDFWATLEHDIKYKTDEKLPKKVSKELVNFAKVINNIDVNMSKFYGK